MAGSWLTATCRPGRTGGATAPFDTDSISGEANSYNTPAP